MTVEQAIEYIHSNKWHNKRPGLDRIRALLAALGNPQKAVRCIHVAGTNGKGSVCAMLDSILRAAGYRVGLFTSPYIRRFHERIQADGKQIDDAMLAEITEYVKPFAEAMEDSPTEFELITAIGFEFFRRLGVEYVILEVGLGGRLDPTNVIKNPLLSIITDIDFDHTEQLGNTIQTIAAEKAGIIKTGLPCMYGGRDSSACRTIAQIAALKQAPFYTVDRTDYRVTEMNLSGTTFNFQDETDLRLPLLGIYQPFNAAIVLTALRIIEQNGVTVTRESLRRGLENVTWPARFELIRTNPIVICDGGHNPNGIAAAVQSIQRYFPEQRVNLLVGIMEDKSFDEMIELLKPIANRVFTVAPNNPRSIRAVTLKKYFESHSLPATAYESTHEAVKDAVSLSAQENTPLLCLGSLYLYGEIVDLIRTAL